MFFRFNIAYAALGYCELHSSRSLFLSSTWQMEVTVAGDSWHLLLMACVRENNARLIVVDLSEQGSVG